MSKGKQVREDTVTVLKNVEEFVQALSLTGVSTFAIIASYTQRDYSNWYYLLFGAGIVQVLIAFSLLVKHFKKS